MKNLKKLLAVVLSLAMVLGSLTVTAFAAETEISDLAGLTTALTDGGEYKLTADISLGKAAATAIAAGVNVTLDLNGHSITRSSGGAVLTNNGTLTIKDTSAAADGFIGFSSPTNTTSTINTMINNKGTINLQSGGFKQMKSTASAATVILTTGTINMTGGFITGIVTENRRAVQIGTNGVFNFSGGEIYGNTVGTGADIFNFNGTVNISDNAMLNGSVKNATSGTPVTTISGGWFSAQPDSDFIAEGHMWSADTTTHAGYAGQVIEGSVAKVAEVTIGSETTQYETFDAAIAAAVATTTSATIKLLDNCEKTAKVSKIAEGTSVTLDLNGYTLTNTHDVTKESSGEWSTNNRCFEANGTLTIQDTSSEQTGTIIVNQSYTGKAAVSYANGANAKVYVTGGNFYSSAAAVAESTNNCWMNTAGGTHIISGGWFSEWARPTNNASYVQEGYTVVSVDDESKAATPYTVSNTTKTINYLKNGGTGTDVPSETYSYKAGYTTYSNVKSLSYTKAGFTCVGWSTDAAADPDGTNLIASGEAVNFADETKFPGDTIDLFAIYKQVDPSMWVCVDTQDPTIGYADLASAFQGSSDVTLIKNVTGRATIETAEFCRLNLNGYNIIANTAEEATGSALVIKCTLSIYNEDAGLASYPFGGEGKVEGYAQGTGGAIDVIGSIGAVLNIYGGTFTGDAPTHGTVLTNSGVGKTYIYGGTFIPANAESTIDSLYANTGKIFIMPSAQSDVKIQGVMAKAATGTIGVASGYFSALQPAATLGSYDETNDRMTPDQEKSLIANTGDTTYPYSVGATPWKITYNLGGGENSSENPATVSKTDETVITLQPATKTGYTFLKWTDSEGNEFTTLKGVELDADLTLNAVYEPTSYTITYSNLYDGTNTNPATYTIEDNITLVDAERPGTNYYMTKWTVDTKDGDEITGWNAGEKTGNITLWANWSGYQAEVAGQKYKTFDEAIAAAKATEGTATIKLLKNLTLEARVDLRNGACSDFVVDLNGNNITKKTFTNSGLFIYEGSLTITGKGIVTDNSSNTETSGNRSIACQAKDAVLKIEGGTYEKFVKATSNASSVEGNEGAGAIITAGTFSFDPTASLNEGSMFDETEAPYTVYVAAAGVTTAGVTTLYKFTKSSTLEKSALDNIVDGSEMKLYKDAQGKKTFDTNMTFTINLNGYSYEKVDTEAGTTETIDELLTAAAGHEIFFSQEEDVITVTIKDEVLYDITYVVGEGTNPQANPAKYSETTATFQLADAVPTDEAYSFQGWYDEAEGGNRITEIAKGTTGNITLYARYSNVAVAQVVINGVRKNYVSIQAAVEAALANPDAFGRAYITLTGNPLDDTIVLNNGDTPVVIDFGGNNIAPFADRDLLVCNGNATVTIENGETTTTSNSTIVVNSGHLAYDLTIDTQAPIISKGIVTNGFGPITDPTIVDQQESASYPMVMNASLADTINPILYYYFAPKAGSTDELTIKTVVNGNEATISGTRYVDGIYRFTTTSITPNLMAEDIVLTPMCGEEVIGASNTVTILGYLEDVAETTTNTKLLSLIADLINYGSELQKYMQEGKAFNVPTNLQQYVTTAEPSFIDSVKDTTVSATDASNYLIKSASLNVDTKVSTFFIVYSTDSSAKLKVTIDGTTKFYTLADCPVITSMGDNFYRVQCDALTALQYDSIITASLVNSGETTVYHEVTYSVNSYCYAMGSKTLASTALTKAIFRYGKSAEAYENRYYE